MPGNKFMSRGAEIMSAGMLEFEAIQYVFWRVIRWII
jgi:hypothetical protein